MSKRHWEDAFKSRPSLGLLTVHSTGLNQHGEVVISFVSTTFVERRPVSK
jgi:acyl dehydratase